MKKSSSDKNPKEGHYLPAFDPRLTLSRRSFKISSLCSDDDEGFELRFMEEVLQRDPCNEDALMLLGYAYTRRGDYEKGLDVDARLVRLRPADPAAYYNLACSHALLGQINDSVDALERAVSLGYREVKQMMNGLVTLRNLKKL